MPNSDSRADFSIGTSHSLKILLFLNGIVLILFVWIPVENKAILVGSFSVPGAYWETTEVCPASIWRFQEFKQDTEQAVQGCHGVWPEPIAVCSNCKYCRLPKHLGTLKDAVMILKSEYH